MGGEKGEEKEGKWGWGIRKMCHLLGGGLTCAKVVDIAAGEGGDLDAGHAAAVVVK